MTTDAPRRTAPEPASTVGFDVIDVLGGLVTLERRSPTLGGSVPHRVAQACSPLVAGNAFGFQLVLQRRIEIRRGLLGHRVTAFERGDEIARLHRAALPMLEAEGILHPASAWRRVLAAGVVGGRASLTLFTGLFVRPRAGLRLRQASTRNRRSLAYSVREAILDDPEGYCPVVLELDPSAPAFALVGEIATLAVLPATTTFATYPLEVAEDVARAHAAFFDAEYFATKRRGEIARKYRHEIASRAPATPAGAPHVDLVEAGPRTVEPGRPTRLHRPAGPHTTRTAAADRLVVRNAVSFAACFDGLDLRIEPDAARLASFADEVRRRWQPLFTRWGEAAHQGALLYFTKYFTPHPPGEPHLFVKPAALVRTPGDVSTLIEGLPGPGYEVLRGVVETDAFHATPAVFALTHPGRRIEVGEGAPLAELFAVPRALLGASFAVQTLTP